MIIASDNAGRPATVVPTHQAAHTAVAPCVRPVASALSADTKLLGNIERLVGRAVDGGLSNIAREALTEIQIIVIATEASVPRLPRPVKGTAYA